MGLLKGHNWRSKWFRERSNKQRLSRLMKSVFYPDSVAVIGASSDSERERNSGWVGRLVAVRI